VIKDYRRRENCWIIRTSNITFCTNIHTFIEFLRLFSIQIFSKTSCVRSRKN